MGSINLDNTGSGSGITLSSDGTSLLLDGTAIGGGGADLYAANESSPTAQPSATGANAVAIGDSSVASGALSFAAAGGTASGSSSKAIGGNSTGTSSISIGGTGSSNYSIGIGHAAVAGTGLYATSIGYNTAASGENSLAVGGQSQSTGNKSVAVGKAKATGDGSFAAVVDNNTSSYGASGSYSMAIGGRLAKATTFYSVALGGQSNIASGNHSIAMGDGSTASHANSVSIGDSVQSTAANQINLGGTADTVRISETYTLPTADGTANQVLTTDGSGAVTFADAGGGADLYAANESSPTAQPSATGSNSIAIGDSAVSSGLRSIALGTSRASNTESFAAVIGDNTTSYGALGGFSVALGYLAKVDSGSAYSMAMGRGPQVVSSQRAVAMGNNPRVTSSNYAVAIGDEATVSFGESGVALGTSYVGGTEGFAAAIGNKTSSYGATGANSIALGQLSQATATNSIAIGDTATSTTANQIALGGTTDTVKISGAYTLPTADGSANQVLTTDGSGAVTFADASGGISNVVEDTSPQLGGNLDVQAREINTSTTNGNIVFNPNGTGVVEVKGAGGNDGTLQLNCSANSHGVKIKSPPHSAGASYTLTLPNDDGDASEFLQTNGSGVLTWAAAGASLYSANESSPSAQPSATGANAIAIGDSAVSSSSSSVAIGESATATGYNTFAVGKSRASATGATALNIENNTSSYGASNPNSFAAGDRAKATGYSSTAIGDMPIASNHYATAIGKQTNATALYSTALGFASKSSIYGKLAYASGYFFSTYGDAQGGQFILRGNTTDATAKVLTTDNEAVDSDNQVIANSDTCISFDGTITAMQNGAQAYASWKIEGLLVNDGGTTTLANSAITVIQNSSNWGLALSADNTNNALAVTCTGEANHNIRWVANIRTSEVTYA